MTHGRIIWSMFEKTAEFTRKRSCKCSNMLAIRRVPRTRKERVYIGWVVRYKKVELNMFEFDSVI